MTDMLVVDEPVYPIVSAFDWELQRAKSPVGVWSPVPSPEVSPKGLVTTVIMVASLRSSAPWRNELILPTHVCTRMGHHRKWISLFRDSVEPQREPGTVSEFLQPVIVSKSLPNSNSG